MSNDISIPAGKSELWNENGPWHEGTKGERIAVRLSSLETNGSYTIVESVAAPGIAVPMHLHQNEEEHFIILAGKYRFSIDGTIFERSAGESTTVPKNAHHSWRNVSSEPSRMLVCLTPGGFEQCIQTIHDNPPEKILEIAASYGCHIVGPPVEA